MHVQVPKSAGKLHVLAQEGTSGCHTSFVVAVIVGFGSAIARYCHHWLTCTCSHSQAAVTCTMVMVVLVLRVLVDGGGATTAFANGGGDK